MLIVVSLMSQAVASIFIAVFITLTAILIAGLLEHKRALEMDQEYDELADSREVFWNALHMAYNRFRESTPQLPEQLDDLILADSILPDFKPLRIKDLPQWLRENEDKLSQYTLWRFASSIYPMFQEPQSLPVDYSLMEPAYAVSFREAQSKLVRFWNKWVPLNEWFYFFVYFKPMRYICEHYALARNQIIMLTWLELALIRRTRDHGRSGIALFKIAQKMRLET